MKAAQTIASYTTELAKAFMLYRDLDLAVMLAEPATPRFQFAAPMTDDNVEKVKNPKMLNIRTQNRTIALPYTV